jgi:bifunctional non-homologous end joining protein LigD
MVWDRGTYEWLGAVPPDKQIAHGKIDIVLHGQKLRGSFAVVRVGKGTVRASHEDRWLLIKRRDQYSDPSWNIEKPEFDHSVLTGRALKQIKEGDSEKSARRTRSRVRA